MGIASKTVGRGLRTSTRWKKSLLGDKDSMGQVDNRVKYESILAWEDSPVFNLLRVPPPEELLFLLV